ncbi:MAG: hypothetical protein Q7S02_00910 [bacterium]|nr:hypothetical protein [bacterium]
MFYVDIERPAIRMAIEIIARSRGAIIAPTADDAAIVVSDDQRKLLGHLKAGKRVVQLCLGPTVEVASGLATAPNFADRFRAFRVRFDAEEAEFYEFLAYIGACATEVR